MNVVDEGKRTLEVDKPSFDELRAIALGHMSRVLEHYTYKKLAGFYLTVLSAEAFCNQQTLFPPDVGMAEF